MILNSLTKRGSVVVVLWALWVVKGFGQEGLEQQFDVASIKPNPGCRATGQGFGKRGGPGTVKFDCITLEELIKIAFGDIFTGPALGTTELPVVGGPDWLRSDYYSVLAKAEGTPSASVLYGSMLRGLLRDRFQLKVHREFRDTNIFELKVDKGGLKLLQTEDGSCRPLNVNALVTPPNPRSEPSRPLCGLSWVNAVNGLTVLTARGMTLSLLAWRLRSFVDRPVVEHTGLTTLFDVHLEFAQTAPAAGPSVGTASEGSLVFVAVKEQLGLELVPGKAPQERIVIDSVKRPSEN